MSSVSLSEWIANAITHYHALGQAFMLSFRVEVLMYHSIRQLGRSKGDKISSEKENLLFDCPFICLFSLESNEEGQMLSLARSLSIHNTEVEV